MSFNDYWADPRFAPKIPDKKSPSAVVRRGDNIYEPFGIGTFRQLPSSHSLKDGSEDPRSLKHDLGGHHVLVAGEFVYFGGAGPDLPIELECLVVGRGHRCQFTPAQVEAVSHWVSEQPQGVRGRPTLWPAGDDSWREGL